MRRLGWTVFFLAAASPALAEDCKPLQRYATIPFEDDGSGRMSVPATLGGRATRLTVDTGAYWSSIREDLAKELKLTIKTSYYIVLIDAAGEKLDKIALVPDVRVGSANYGEAEFFVMPPHRLPIERDGGVLGQNLLAQVDLELDSAARTISLYSQDHCEEAGVHWTDSAVILSYKRQRRAPPLGSRIRAGIDKNQIDPPIVQAEIEGQAIAVLFDTGASRTFMDADLAKRRFGIDKNSPGVELGGTAFVAGGSGVDTFKYTFKSLTISGIRFDNIPVFIGDFGDTTQLILGMNQMKHLHIFFAFKEGRIYVTAADAGRPQ